MPNSDTELFHEIARAVQGVAADDKSIAAAVAKVRSLLGGSSTSTEREAKSVYNRKESGGQTRSE